MLVLEINGKKKEVPCQWEEMTIDFYCGLYQIINKYKVTEEQKKDDEGKDLERFYFTQETKMYKEIFSYMTEVPLDDVEKANMEDVMAVINSLDNIMVEYKPKGIDSFIFEGEKYYFPFEFLKTSTFGEYIEANQLELSTQYLKNGRFDILPEQMAILCKTMDEEVDLDNIDEKAKKFKNLTMDIVWEFSFFLNKRTMRSLGVIATFLGKAAQKVSQ
jgi:hypothetical protein|tara:strand:+ start:190 stop:840 length:651 start_codon:yes stop_codon:yes gene_type:complete